MAGSDPSRARSRRGNLFRMNNPVLFEGEHLVFRRCRGWEYVEHRTAKESVMVVARTPGIPVAWINRKSELRCLDAEPDAEVSNLTGLSDWLESGR